jgi:hypothetical protein
MDGQQFDRWARTIAAASSRRGLLKSLVGAVAGGLFAARTEEAAARSCRRGDPDGTPCGGCGVCKNNVCVVDPTFVCGGCLQCDPRRLTCRPNDDRCTACERCESDGTCKNLKCKEKCCNHRCIPKDACCKHADCGECGLCDRGRCRNDPAKIGQKCGSSGCEVCTNRGCANQIDNAGCFDRDGLCCDGVCCPSGQSCCGRTCCAGVCVDGICCAFGSAFTAAGTELCCPFGPPCGEGNAARCCGENQHCCESSGLCCDAGQECCGTTCCSAGQHCCDGQCQVEDCSCGAEERRCPDGRCCDRQEFCTTDVCCNLATAQPCCKELDFLTGECAGPCCPYETEQCWGNEAETDFWCCPKGLPGYKDGCCPSEKPIFTAGPDGIFCCPDPPPGPGDEPEFCTQTPIPGRRS